MFTQLHINKLASSCMTNFFVNILIKHFNCISLSQQTSQFSMKACYSHCNTLNKFCSGPLWCCRLEADQNFWDQIAHQQNISCKYCFLHCMNIQLYLGFKISFHYSSSWCFSCCELYYTIQVTKPVKLVSWTMNSHKHHRFSPWNLL